MKKVECCHEKEPEIKSIKLDDIRPRLIFSNYFIGNEEYEDGLILSERTVYNYELEFFTDSKGEMTIDGETFQIQFGDIVFRKPGNRTIARMPYDCYGVFFDMTGNCQIEEKDYFSLGGEYQPIYRNSFIDKIPMHYNCTDPNIFKDYFKQIFLMFIHDDQFSQLMISSLISSLLYKIYEDAKYRNQNSGKIAPIHFEKFKKVEEYIRKNLDEPISIKSMSEVACLSQGHFRYIFKGIYGVTATEYLIKHRIIRAKELLASSRLSLAEIGLECGFQSQAYFSYVFKKNIGISPLAFRKKHSFIF